MAIVKMRKLQLVAMSYDRDALLDALHRTGAVEITLHTDEKNTVIPTSDSETERERLLALESTLGTLSSAVESYAKDHALPFESLKDGFEITYSEFQAAKDLRERVETTAERVREWSREKTFLQAELVKVRRELAVCEPYRVFPERFDSLRGGARISFWLGTVASQRADELTKALEEIELCAYKRYESKGDSFVLLVAAHKESVEKTGNILSSFGFLACPYTGSETGVGAYERLQNAEREVLQRLQENDATVYALKDEIRPFKIYCDYLAFVLEKVDATKKMRSTERTFFMQAFVPAFAEETVKEAIVNTATAYLEFTDPLDSDEPPTLMQNNSIVSSFEPITNTYSAPNYREFDPNAVMAFFYSLFMGFIIGDAGYGLLMAIVGGLLWYKGKAKPSGLSKLAGAFACGGVFAIIWGFLFNSLFGLAILPKTVMPNPQKDMWQLAGISVPSVLIISMEIGIVQLFTGYICKAVQSWRRGEIVDGICEGVLWALFSLGVALAIVGFVEEAGLPVLATVGGITAGVSLFLAMITAGRKEKLFGKFTKGFGAVYGVINYASDVLSYARLYGLMLSGAVIAQIIATYSTQFLLSGNIALIALAVVLLVIGHGFNLVMNLLGAYIHDARLQYVEFYGRFFEGEGALFAPLGVNRKYVSVRLDS